MKRKFSPHGLLALAPAAVDAEFDRATPRTELTPALALVTVRGPLYSYADADGHFDSYEGIRRRVALALESDAPIVVLAIDSPGGIAAGFIELARDLRASAQRAGKELIAYVDGQGCSAAYGLACACSRIFVGESASVGSVGIIEMLADQTALNRASGIRVVANTSGKRKADGNPNTPVTDDAIEASKARVEQLARAFFDLVGKARGMSSTKVRALEAGIFMGREAVAVGLADGVATFDEMIALVAGKSSPKASSATKPAPQVQAGAMAIAGGASAPKPPARASAARSIPKPTAPAPAAQKAASPMSDTARLNAIEASQRETFFAARPHLPQYLRDALASAPLTKVRRVVAAWEGRSPTVHTAKGPDLAHIDRVMGVSQPRAEAVVHRKLASHFGSAPEVEGDARALARIDAAMGVTPMESTGVVHTEYQTILGAPKARA